MRKSELVLTAMALAGFFAGGLWLGQQTTQVPLPLLTAPSAVSDAHSGQEAGGHAGGGSTTKPQILDYQHPDGRADFSPIPKKDEHGREYQPIYADPTPRPATSAVSDAGIGAVAGIASGPTEKRRILYYRHPMGLADTSPVPKKDAMGMAYVPVYESEEDGGRALKIGLDKVQKLGVRTEAAQRRVLTRMLRAVGTVQVDERNVHVVTPKFEGYIERLHINQTGQAVAHGQALMEVYSPDLVLAQQEYVIALNGVRSLEKASPEARAAAFSLVEGALARLKNWDIPPAQIERLRATGQPSRTLSLVSPSHGVVMEKRALQGMRFMPGEMLYQIADLSNVWVIAEVFEQDLALVKVGQDAKVTFQALPGLVFGGKITFVYPTVTPETRTARVRIELPNEQGRLRPALYGNVEMATSVTPGPVLGIPDSAVLDTGTRQVVLVERGEGLYEPREIQAGSHADGWVEVIEGLKEGERVVVRANFLIDAESNLKAALQGFQNR